MGSFFPMRRADRWLLWSLLGYSALSFLPSWRSMEIGGLAVFGWLMAGLMLLSPTAALLVLLRERREATTVEDER